MPAMIKCLELDYSKVLKTEYFHCIKDPITGKPLTKTIYTKRLIRPRSKEVQHALAGLGLTLFQIESAFVTNVSEVTITGTEITHYTIPFLAVRLRGKFFV